MDSENVRFYSVFPRENDVAEWYYTADRVALKEWFWFFGLWRGFDTIELHPMSKEIIELALDDVYHEWQLGKNGSTAYNPVPGNGGRAAAAKLLANRVYWNIDYNRSHKWWNSDFTILNLNGRNTAGHPAGVCVDKAAVYISFARSLGIPVRSVWFWGENPTEGRDGHAWVEVYVDGRWVPVDPTWFGLWDSPDVYALSGWENLECQVETSPGVMDHSPSITAKYAVYLKTPSVQIVGNEGTEIIFANASRSCGVKDFKIEVVDTGGIPRIEVSGLSRGGVLLPGSEDHCTLRVWGAKPRYDAQGNLVGYSVILKISYTTVDGRPCLKTSQISVVVKS
jgi:transglutaminase-like putative cysteine protease